MMRLSFTKESLTILVNVMVKERATTRMNQLTLAVGFKTCLKAKEQNNGMMVALSKALGTRVNPMATDVLPTRQALNTWANSCMV